MKKVLFLMRYPLSDAYNLKLKFNGQMQACVNLGYQVFYLGYDENKYYLCSFETGEKREVGKTHFHSYSGYRSTVAFFDLYSALSAALKTERFDYIYMRNKLVTSKAVSALKKHKDNGGKLIVEIPTYGVKEASLNLIRKLANRYFAGKRKRFEQLVDSYTLIGENCPSVYKGKPAIEISNGISLEKIPMKKHLVLNSEIHMIALASMRDWQGFDRVVRGIGGYSGKERLVLHLVGQDFDGSIQRWTDTATELGVADDVIYHGALYGQQLTDLFDNCHMAIGAMAMHRRGNVTGSPLKVREYIARGIPFIYSYDDTALSGNEWFALKFSEDDSAVDFHTVVPWITEIYKNSGMIEKIRQFAKEKLLWEAELKPVFAEAEEVLNG